MRPDAEVVPVVQAPIEAERLDGAQDDTAGLAAVERGAREVDREIGIAEVLSGQCQTCFVCGLIKEYTYVVHGPAAAPPADEGHAGGAQRGEVHLLPRVLVPADDDARRVAVEEEQRLRVRLVSEQPSRGGVTVGPGRAQGKAGTDQSSSERLKYGFVDSET